MTALRYWDSFRQQWFSIAGPPTVGVPPGGAVGTVLRKNSGVDWDVSWQPQSGTIVQDRAGSTISGWGSLGTGAWVVLGAASTTNITKQFAGTTLRCELGISGYVSPNPGQMMIGANPTGSIIQIANYYFNSVSDHQGFTGMRDFGGIAAGALTFNWYIQMASTNGYSDNDYFWWRVQEVWP